MVERAFRFQTGEVEDIAKEIRASGSVEVDVIKEDRIKPFLLDLEGHGIYERRDNPWDYEAINFYDDHDFVCRVFIKDTQTGQDAYIDFYSDYDEKSYDPIFFG